MIDFDLLSLLVCLGIFLLLVLLLPKKSIEYYLYAFLFFCYITMLISYTLFPIILGDTNDKVYLSHALHFIPFSNGIGKTDLLNIIMFIPMGFLLPFVFRKINSLVKIGLTSLLVSILIELLQLLEISGIFNTMSMRIVDVNDIICNTIGGVIGYCLLFLISKISTKKLSNSKSKIILYAVDIMNGCKVY